MENNSFLEVFGKFLQLQQQPNKLSEELFKNGWYPIKLIARVEKDPQERIDGYMERLITGRYYDQIKKEYCYEQYPDRAHILKEAFLLFEQERYIACIPLFLAQADGIAKDFGTHGVFAGKEKDEAILEKKKFLFYISKKIGNNTSINNILMKLFYSSIFIGIEEYKNISLIKHTDTTNTLENNSLNRHGIMHGNKEYLNYGTRTNALKTISFILFVINLISDFKQLELDQ